MTNLLTDEPNEEDARPALLGRIRPIARVTFGLIALSTIATLAYVLWGILRAAYESASAR
jgi:hypothetical protein